MMLRMLCVFSAATIAMISDGSVSFAGPPFVVTIEVSVSGGARPIIKGTTNLPDGTQLMISLIQPWLPDAKERLAKGLTACGNDNCAPLQTYSKLPDGVGFGVVVKNSQFNDGPFTYEGAALRPGNYVLEVSSFFAVTQPENVRAVIGPLGENMTGPLVGGCCFGHHKSQVEIQNELDKMRRAVPTLGATIYFARNVVVGPAAQPSAPPVTGPVADQPPAYTQQSGRPFGGLRWKDGYVVGFDQFKKADWRIVEADNGAVYALDMKSIQQSRDEIHKNVKATVYIVEGELFDPTGLRAFMFDCAGHFQVSSGYNFSPMSYAPPRSVIGQIAAVACAGARQN